MQVKYDLIVNITILLLVIINFGTSRTSERICRTHMDETMRTVRDT